MAIRLLIADDNAEFRKSTQMMVSLEDDIEVVSLARDGQEAVEMARQHQPDVAVIDVHMPKVDGLTAIRAVANVSPGTVCMAMSYDGEREILRQAMAAGAREYLIKPFNSDEFLNALRRVAARAALPAARTAGLSRAGSRPLPPAGSLPRTGSLVDAATQRQQEQELIQTAVSYLRAGRTDNEAARVYGELVKLRNMDTATLTRLAEIFLARRDWQTLRLICERLEKQTKNLLAT
ncbi:MAG: response regulator [Anaerolineales bacterium]|nr:response regulator [Anaerolineales bacterium]